jgi:predicted AAA+ superfamily ATPase
MIERKSYMEKIEPFMETDLIKVFTGIRRCGKSVMLELIQMELKKRGVKESRFIKINFEDMANSHICEAKALHKYVQSKIKEIKSRCYLFLDEIQEVKTWEKCINSIRATSDCDIYVTGSNANLLSGEFATYLAGRYIEFKIYPFSFSEFLEIYKLQFPKVSEQDVFKVFIEIGGMPFLSKLKFDYTDSMQYLRDIYNSVMLKDIIKRNNVRQIDLHERIISFVMANAGKSFSATSISKYFKSEQRIVAAETVLNHLRYCENAHLFYRLSRQDIDSKKIFSINEKYYVADHGLKEAITGKSSRNISTILENIVCMELLKRGYSLFVGRKNALEVDFIAEKNNSRIYVQVAYLLASEETIEREFLPLKKIKDNYPKYVLSMDTLDFSQEGIAHKNIMKSLTDNFF